MTTSSSSTMLLLRRAMATAAKNAGAATTEVAKAPGTGNPKKKNLFDVARLLPGWGIGHKVAKSHWKPHSYYKLYDVKLRKDAGHGVAWGIYHEEGVEAGKLQKISGANKRCWKYVADGPERTWQFVASQKTVVPDKEKMES
ncbi:uncharacterized protein [Physcomitrium patens]|uniref:Uncharacterized protein n=1 Tax=Physcomitrium patens TaxID=3218 RepID=A0A2K1K2K2_PHYPA|nr:uncharacterized protein LOC112286360 [Physcomitrium patens]PNR48000.1 hypothetical protein PHYPA_012473 [Physcomitrium patens]|eukprot:XP_024383939.1 uncharacterized protein LOC112286360 [Physcomitrella patens]